VINDLGLDRTKVNPMGGAIALGHPLGATGAIRSATLVHALRRRTEIRHGDDVRGYRHGCGGYLRTRLTGGRRSIESRVVRTGDGAEIAATTFGDAKGCRAGVLIVSAMALSRIITSIAQWSPSGTSCDVRLSGTGRRAGGRASPRMS
jgi:hypothetical protein